MVYDGTTTGLSGFGEVVVDRIRMQAGQDVLSVMYQKSSSGSTPSELRVVEFLLNA